MWIQREQRVVVLGLILTMFIFGCGRAARVVSRVGAGAPEQRVDTGPVHEPPGVCGDDICQEDEPRTCPDDCRVVFRTRDHFGADLLWYGVQQEKTTRQTLDAFAGQVRNLGMEIVRFDVYWGLLEPNKGRYDWRLTDDLVGTVDPNIDILFTVYSTNRWGSKYNECRDLIEQKMDRNVVNEPPSSLPINMQDYMNFLDALVRRYSSRVKYWQVENEIFGAQPRANPCPPVNRFWLGTPEEYLTLLKASYRQIKQADPSATVFASSYTFEPWDGRLKDFFRYVMDKGRDYSDLWDLHLYLGVAEDPAKIRTVKREMNRLGYSKPLWTTESGEIDIYYAPYKKFKGNLNAPDALRYQSEDLVKRYVQAFGEGVEKVFRLRIAVDGVREGPMNRWTHMSLAFDRDGREKRPAYHTYEIMYSKLRGFDEVRRIGDRVYKFKVNGRSVVVAWALQGSDIIDLSSHFPGSNVKVTHIIAQPGKTAREARTEVVPARSVSLTSAPIFVEQG